MKSKFKPRGTWREKLEKKQSPEIKQAPEIWAKKHGGYKMLIPTPMLVDRMMRKIPEGRLATIGSIRNALAKEFGADFTCPLTTGIFARIAAETAEEDRANGRKDITPYWRLIKDDGTLNPKFPGGQEGMAKRLQKEGFELVKKGRTKLMVKDFETKLI